MYVERESRVGAWQYGAAIAVALVAAFLLFQTWQASYETVSRPNFAVAATSSTVTVSASVAATISCSTSATSTAFGTLTDASVFTSSPNVSSTMSCANSSAGCTLYVKDAGSGSNPGLWNSTSSSLIESPNAAFDATSTLVAGTEGYGIQATTTSAGSGATLTLAARYNQSGNTVGGLTLTNTTLASASATSSGREVVVTHKAAIATVTPAGTYNDTITYECTAN
jgi:hypothetical protein